METLKTGKSCPIIRGNVTTKIPPYPYISFNITSPTLPHGGTNGRLGTGTYAEWLEQMWSFTVHAGGSHEATEIAGKVWDWFRQTGIAYLDDHEIAVRWVGGVNCRDNFISNQYESRQGFDVKLGLVNIIEYDEPIIDTAEYNTERTMEIE